MRTSAELREGFLAYFESKGHQRRASASLVPATHDPSVLLTTAGMQPLKPFFLGVEPAPAPRVTTIQKCFRTTDIDSVGLTARHLTFFEMMGNFSFGDYFKDGAIEFAWEFVSGHLGFPEERLWATVFAGDPELGLGEDEVAVRGWQRMGVPADRIRGLPRTDNFWQAGPVGPCGPCSELYYDRGQEYGCGRPECGPGCSCDRFLEFWNLVFMELNLHDDGSLTPLPEQNIDTGMGVERTAALLQDVSSVYDTDGFRTIMAWAASEAGVQYGESELATKAHRVLADHGRAMTFLTGDGVLPSNEGRGYVLRRIVRRAVQHGTRIGLESPFLVGLADVVIELMSATYPDLAENRALIHDALRAEEERFARTLATGSRLLEEVLDRSPDGVSGADAFALHDTYGFPLELTVELAEERGLPVDVDSFREHMAAQRDRSRAGRASEADRAAAFAREAGFRSEFVGYAKLDVLTQLGSVEHLGDGLFLGKLRESPFYADGGGQVSDQGWIEKDSGEHASLISAFRFGDDQALLFEGDGFASGDRVRALVPWDVRFPTEANHTATHLLHHVLRQVLGDHVRQAGSAVRPDKLRFDFTHAQPLTGEERGRVEQLVNEQIVHNHPVRTYLTPIDEARKLGATMLFGEKYGDIVRVVEIGAVSTELCGGAHVRASAEIGAFKILAESSVGAATRRIEAVTSGAATAYLFERDREAVRLAAELELERRAWKKRERELRSAGDTADDALTELLEGAVEIAGVTVVTSDVGALDADGLLELSDRVKQKADPAAVMLAARADERANLVVNLSQGATERGLDASAIVKAACAVGGGGGGGRAGMARGGGLDPERLSAALDAAAEAVRSALG